MMMAMMPPYALVGLDSTGPSPRTVEIGSITKLKFLAET